MPEWSPYKIAVPGLGEPGVEGGAFDSVLHVAHLKEARRILEDGFLRAGLVNDGSRLDTSRTCVTFFSANTWNGSSIYGNVQWRYDWRKLIAGKNIFWVEAKLGYAYPIYRFLISERTASALPGLTLYDPKADKGPLRQHGDKWYFQWKDHVSEFLFDGDLTLDSCEEFEFVNHHKYTCKNGSCADKGRPFNNAMAQTMAYVFGCEIRSLDQILRRPPRHRKDKRLHDRVDEGLGQISLQLGKYGKFRPSGDVDEPTAAAAITRGVLALYGTGQIENARNLVKSLKSFSVFNLAIERIVEEHFGIENWSLTEED